MSLRSCSSTTVPIVSPASETGWLRIIDFPANDAPAGNPFNTGHLAGSALRLANTVPRLLSMHAATIRGSWRSPLSVSAAALRSSNVSAGPLDSESI